MMFCPKCGSMLRPKLVKDKKVMACSCGYVAEKGSTMTFGQKREDEVKLEVIEKEDSTRTLVDEECPKCKHKQAYYWSQQMRAGDEPETQFYKCASCGNTWRDGR